MSECKCTRTLSIDAKVDDRCAARFNNGQESVANNGYVPRGLNIGGGDYLKFVVCIDCGKIKNFEALADEDIKESIEDM